MEQEGRDADMRLYLNQALGERVLLVDDILRSGSLLREAQLLLESRGCRVVGVAVLFHKPTPWTTNLGAEAPVLSAPPPASSASAASRSNNLRPTKRPKKSVSRGYQRVCKKEEM